MILNLLRIEDFKVEDMIKRSFSEFSTQKILPEQKKMLLKIESKLKQLETIKCIFGEPDIENYYFLENEYKKLENSLQNMIIKSKQGLQSLISGRIVIIKTKVMYTFQKKKNNNFFRII